MARFYGTVQGGRREATRLGHASTGLHVSAQSYSGDVIVDLMDVEGEDYVRIYVCSHKCSNHNIIYEGLITNLLEQTPRATYASRTY